MNAKKNKKQFPLLKKHKKLVYLDSAASTQTLQVVLDAMQFYYQKRRANVHRGAYQLSGLATQLYEESRDTIAEFINAYDKEIIFTSGATHGLNLLAYSLCKNLKKGDNVVLTRMEHHANLVPWIQMSKQYGFEIRYIEMIPDFKLQTSDMPIDENTKIVSFCHISNALGTINPAKKIVDSAKKVGAISIIDAAQSVGHVPVDVKELDCDALVFSGHKMYGPTGVGVLYAKQALLEKIDPFFFGGDMIREVTYEDATWNDLPWKFEAGTPNIAGVIGLAAAIRYIGHIGIKNIAQHAAELSNYAYEKLSQREGISVVGDKESRSGIISFVVEGIHPHDVASILDQHNVAVRAGHHCTMPLMSHIGLPGTVRLSVGIYNTQHDIDTCIDAIKQAQKTFQIST